MTKENNPLQQEYKNLYAKNFFNSIDGVAQTIKKRKVFFDMLETVYPKRENFNQEQIDHMVEILQIIKNLDQALKPLRDHKLNYTLDLSGGALYDFLTNKVEYTKDVDIIFHLEAQVVNKSNLCVEIMENTERDVKIFNTLFENITGIKRSSSNIYAEDLNALLIQLLSNSYNKAVLKYDSTIKEKRPSYMNSSMFGLININDKNLSKPIDLIISSTEAQFLCYNMDFNLCKIGLNYRNSTNVDAFYEWNKDMTNYLKRNGLESRNLCDVDVFNEYAIESVLKRVYLLPASVYDLYNKTCTLDFHKFTTEHLTHYMDNHYPRIQEKLPEYQLVFRNEHENPDFIKEYNIKQLYKKINNELDQKDSDMKKMKL
jgi:hypothetical protein